MTREQVAYKNRDLLVPVIGKARTEKLIEAVWNIERLQDMRKLRPLLSLRGTR